MPVNYTNTKQLSAWLLEAGHELLSKTSTLEVDETDFNKHLAELSNRHTPKDQARDRAAFRCLTLRHAQTKLEEIQTQTDTLRTLSGQVTRLTTRFEMEAKARRMWRLIFIGIALVLAILLLSRKAHAQNLNPAIGVSVCGTIPGGTSSPTAGQRSYLTVDTNGNLCAGVSVSATVATAGLAVSVTVGSTSGTVMTPVGGFVTTAAPTYVNGQTAPLSLDPTGNLRVNASVSIPGALSVTTPLNFGSGSVAVTGANSPGTAATLSPIGMAGADPNSIVRRTLLSPIGATIVDFSATDGVAPTTGAVPPNALYIGGNAGGLRGLTAVNYASTGMALDVNLSTLAGNNIGFGDGGNSTGNIRVNVSTGNSAIDAWGQQHPGNSTPASAVFQGIDVATRLRGVTGTIFGTTPGYAEDVNIASITTSNPIHSIIDSGTITTVTGVTTVSSVTSVGPVGNVSAILGPLPAGTNVLGHIICDSGCTSGSGAIFTALNFGSGTVAVTGATSSGSAATFSPVRTAGKDANGFVRDLLVSPIGATIVDLSSTAAVTATLAAETTKVIGTVRTLGNAGAIFDAPTGAAVPANVLYTGLNAGTMRGVTGIVYGGTGAAMDVNLAASNATVTANATLSAETTKVIGTVRVLGNAGAIFDAPTTGAVPANALYLGGNAGGLRGITAVNYATTGMGLDINLAMVGGSAVATATTGVAKVGIVGSTGTALDGTVGAAATGVLTMQFADSANPFQDMVCPKNTFRAEGGVTLTSTTSTSNLVWIVNDGTKTTRTAAGSGLKFYIFSVQLSNSGATNATVKLTEDGGVGVTPFTIHDGWVAPTNTTPFGGSNMTFPSGIFQPTSNKALSVAASASSASVFVNVQGCVGP